MKPRGQAVRGPQCSGHDGVVPSTTLAVQVAVVTGASRGVGRQVALHPAGRGAAVAAVARASTALTGRQEEAARAGARLRAFAADVTAPAEVENAFAAVDSDLGAVTLAVACAGPATGPGRRVRRPGQPATARA